MIGVEVITVEEEKVLRESIVKRVDQQKQMLVSVTEQYKRFGETVASIVKPSELITEAIESQRRLVETVKSIQEAIDFSAIQDTIDTILDRIKEIDPQKFNEESIRELKEIAKKFSKMGWSLVIDINDNCFFEDSILQMKKANVDEYMLNFYEEDGHKNLKALAKYIGERIDSIWKEQLDDSIRLFISGDYKVVTPFIMTLIEAEMIRYSGRDKYGGCLRKDFKERIDKVDDEYIFIASYLIEDILAKVFENKKRNDVKGELLNRNLVLHGKSDPKVWGKIEFLKILNIVGSLAMLDDLFEIEKAS